MPDRGSIAAVWSALSLAQLHSLITHLSSVQDVDKTFKPLNPRRINMDNMHIVNVLILGRGGGLVFDAPPAFQSSRQLGFAQRDGRRRSNRPVRAAAAAGGGDVGG